MWGERNCPSFETAADGLEPRTLGRQTGALTAIPPPRSRSVNITKQDHGEPRERSLEKGFLRNEWYPKTRSIVSFISSFTPNVLSTRSTPVNHAPFWHASPVTPGRHTHVPFLHVPPFAQSGTQPLLPRIICAGAPSVLAWAPLLVGGRPIAWPGSGNSTRPGSGIRRRPGCPG